MNVMFFRAAYLASGFAVGCLLISTGASAVDYQRTGRSGAVIKARDYASWDKDCQALGGVVSPVTRPTHGKLTTRQVITVPTMNRFYSGDPCLGRKIRGVLVEYRSNPGFKGVDTFSLRAFWSGAQKGDIDTFTVDVR